MRNLEARIRRLEESARWRSRLDPSWPIGLVEGKDGTIEEILERCRAAIEAGRRPPFVIRRGSGVRPVDSASGDPVR